MVKVKCSTFKPFIALFYGVFLCLFQSCTFDNEAQIIVDKSIAAHWGEGWETIKMEFDFRDIHYTLQRGKDGYSNYSREFEDSLSRSVRDVLVNGEFQRYVQGNAVEVTKDKERAYSNSVNSVMYFNLLPVVLNDQAVNKQLIGEVAIHDKPYFLLKVTFDKDGGGDDHDDVYLYWIDKESYLIDYLAYEFHVDGGGKRFREAINRREIGGVQFQDYKNFKADDAEDIFIIDDLFQQEKLEILSEIINENVDIQIK
ncbi:DUF6503 family protein [Pleomorphovibrio marinus]|uniref:DUF6503 family protein n=1 Tax=Pleomorphovibrio marinus TaxID=2164132 RepID=UPI000E0AC6CB|nr:DUF6503 family protein [Pleomorphovibrio marinus]